jgi:hypothetical protein
MEREFCSSQIHQCPFLFIWGHSLLISILNSQANGFLRGRQTIMSLVNNGLVLLMGGRGFFAPPRSFQILLVVEERMHRARVEDTRLFHHEH